MDGIQLQPPNSRHVESLVVVAGDKENSSEKKRRRDGLIPWSSLSAGLWKQRNARAFLNLHLQYPVLELADKIIRGIQDLD